MPSDFFNFTDPTYIVSKLEIFVVEHNQNINKRDFARLTVGGLVFESLQDVRTGRQAARSTTKDSSHRREEISSFEKAEIPAKRFALQYAIGFASIFAARQ